MAASRWPYVVDAVLAALRTAPGLAGTLVSDGPRLEDSPAWAEIGASLADDDTTAGTITQAYRTSGGPDAARDETVTVACVAGAQSGSTDLAAVRTAAFAVLAQVESALRATPGLAVPGVICTDLRPGSVRQAQTPAGAYCLIAFDITADAVI